MMGISDKIAITTPHNSAPGIPRTQKINPPSAPSTMAIMILPFTVARVTSTNLVNNKVARFLLKGRARVSRLTNFCPRSEEHTSELQSRGHLVCRLLLEKKKKTQEPNRQNQR